MSGWQHVPIDDRLWFVDDYSKISWLFSQLNLRLGTLGPEVDDRSHVEAAILKFSVSAVEKKLM